MADNYMNKRSASSHHDVFRTSAELPRRGPCFWFFRAVKWIPVLFIVAVIAWSYYAYVIQLCFISVQSMTERVLFLLFYHVVFIMFVWSYWQTVFTTIGRVPAKFRIPAAEMERIMHPDNPTEPKRILEIFAKDLPISNRTINGSLRYCDKCQVVKPDRAHHCSVCGTCVLKMDHHCPWVNNCVNFTNYKYFVLFLGYGLLYCIYIALTVLRYFIAFWEGQLEIGAGRFHILFLFFVAAMFAISLVSLFGYHIYLVALNRTTLEAFRTPIFRIGGADKNGFNLGRYNNIQEVFGDDRRLWLLPMFTSLGDGISYPIQLMDEDATTLLGNNYVECDATDSGAENVEF
ncbi:palmitoyltransferase ZDHHC15-like isoform X2 [Contarinia nasturtii]|uniref:palmitoyltransferase ZDHHC15-like isoform X2 n=1 Tax=Contarinia nasturtii TaxID=265458 RepID=UPI0012D40BAC|nr:palmitoyltransferase ZDHHC15-like isoform X2 [Contarinia nasturtii]